MDAFNHADFYQQVNKNPEQMAGAVSNIIGWCVVLCRHSKSTTSALR